MTKGTTTDQLRSLVERIERLTEDKKAVSEDIRGIYQEAKGLGYDTKGLRAVVKLRAMPKAEREEREAILNTYLSALGE